MIRRKRNQDGINTYYNIDSNQEIIGGGLFDLGVEMFGKMGKIALKRAGKDLVNKFGHGLDIHKAILKIAPKKGFVLPGHNFTGPGNPLKNHRLNGILMVLF